MRASTRERERLLGGDAPPGAGGGDKRWSPYEVAWTAGDPWRTWAVPALAALSIYLFLRGQTSAMWVARGGTDVAVSGRKPSSTVASVSYNLPDTVLELVRSREHLLGERARVSRYPVVARRLRHLPAPPPPPPPTALQRRADRPFPPNPTPQARSCSSSRASGRTSSSRPRSSAGSFR